jgi:hypothetical protein
MLISPAGDIALLLKQSVPHGIDNNPAERKDSMA